MTNYEEKIMLSKVLGYSDIGQMELMKDVCYCYMDSNMIPSKDQAFKIILDNNLNEEVKVMQKLNVEQRQIRVLNKIKSYLKSSNETNDVNSSLRYTNLLKKKEVELDSFLEEKNKALEERKRLMLKH